MKSSLVAAVAALLCCATTASAAVVEVVYTGTVGFGGDALGLFGTAGASLTGDAFTISFLFDTTSGYIVTGPTNNHAIGWGADSPALTATVTINGLSVTAALPDAYGAIVGCNSGDCDGSPSEQSHAAQETDTTGSIAIGASIKGGVAALPASITSPFEYTAVAGDVVGGYVEIHESGISDYTFASYCSPGETNPLSACYLKTATLTVAVVPEPSSWALMLAGFAGLGLAVSRKPRTGRATA